MKKSSKKKVKSQRSRIKRRKRTNAGIKAGWGSPRVYIFPSTTVPAYSEAKLARIREQAEAAQAIQTAMSPFRESTGAKLVRLESARKAQNIGKPDLPSGHIIPEGYKPVEKLYSEKQAKSFYRAQYLALGLFEKSKEEITERDRIRMKLSTADTRDDIDDMILEMAGDIDYSVQELYELYYSPEAA